MAAVLLDFDKDLEAHPYPIFARSNWEIPQPPQSWVKAEQLDANTMNWETAKAIGSLRRDKQENVNIRSLSTHVYSCVSLLFSSRRAWIDIDHIYDIFREDKYHEISKQSLSVGDVVLYTRGIEPSHVGLVTNIFYYCSGVIANICVLSKWGHAGELEHYVDDVPPLCGTPNTYWSEKVGKDV